MVDFAPRLGKSTGMSASQVAALEHENARLSSALEQSNAALAELQADYRVLKQQLEWFQAPTFRREIGKAPGHRPRRAKATCSVHWALRSHLANRTAPPRPSPTKRRNKVRDGAVNDSGLRFDQSVPVKTIEVKDPALEGRPAEPSRGHWREGDLSSGPAAQQPCRAQVRAPGSQTQGHAWRS